MMEMMLFPTLIMLFISREQGTDYRFNPFILKQTINRLWFIPIDLLRKCWKWIETNFITIIFAFALTFVFLYFEKEIVEIVFPFISKIKESNFGIYLLKSLYVILLLALFYFAIKTTINKTLFDGRTVFLSILACVLFVYCATKYPWKLVNPEMAVSETTNSKIVNPIIGHEKAILFLFYQYVYCFLILPLFLYGYMALLKILYLNASRHKQTGNYLLDNPITSTDEDELFFDSHLQILKKRIDEIPNNSSHSIAITGGWGAGKTSFLKLLEQNLNEQHQYEIMWFNPLKSSKTGNIQNDFFDVLESTLSKYKMGFGRRIKYYKELIGAIDNKYISFLVKLWSIQLEEEKQRINDIIKMIPKKIIIIIDDVDRLKGDEIMQVFRLISFNAEFDNVVFLLPLDKGNVIEALGCDTNYPDKFLETEFPLPDNYRHFTSRYVKNTLKTLLADISLGNFLDDQTISDYTSYCINNMRDAKRFINNFIDRVRMIHNKLDIRSYYLLSLIQYKDPVLYEKIRTENKELFEETPNKQFIGLVDDGCSKMDDTIKQILQDLFPSKKLSEGRFIYQLDSFPLYFNDTSTKAVSYVKMLELLLLEPKELESRLNEYRKDEILNQSIVDLLYQICTPNYMKSLQNNKDSKLLITNYYLACRVMQISNGLTYSEGLAPIKISNGLFAYINTQGEVAFKIECNNAFPFSEGLARIVKNGKYSFIDKYGNYGFNNRRKGDLKIRFEYQFASDFSNGNAQVIKGVKTGSIDKNGNFKGRFSLFRLLPTYWKVDENGEFTVGSLMFNIALFSVYFLCIVVFYLFFTASHFIPVAAE